MKRRITLAALLVAAVVVAALLNPPGAATFDSPVSPPLPDCSGGTGPCFGPLPTPTVAPTWTPPISPLARPVIDRPVDEGPEEDELMAYPDFTPVTPILCWRLASGFWICVRGW